MARSGSDFIPLLENDYFKSFIALDRDYNAFKSNILQENLFKQYSTDIKTCVFLNQIHSNYVSLLEKDFNMNSDGIISHSKNTALCILSADCLPLLLIDENKKIIAALHSGRKGCFTNILQEALFKMQKTYDCKIKDVKLIISAGICQNNYQLDGELLEFSRKNFNNFLQDDKFDLKNLVKFQAKELGIEKIFDINICTFDDDRFYSYRRNKTQKRFASVIYLKE